MSYCSEKLMEILNKLDATSRYEEIPISLKIADNYTLLELWNDLVLALNLHNSEANK